MGSGEEVLSTVDVQGPGAGILGIIARRGLGSVAETGDKTADGRAIQVHGEVGLAAVGAAVDQADAPLLTAAVVPVVEEAVRDVQLDVLGGDGGIRSGVVVTGEDVHPLVVRRVEVGDVDLDLADVVEVSFPDLLEEREVVVEGLSADDVDLEEIAVVHGALRDREAVAGRVEVAAASEGDVDIAVEDDPVVVVAAVQEGGTALVRAFAVDDEMHIVVDGAADAVVVDHGDAAFGLRDDAGVDFRTDVIITVHNEERTATHERSDGSIVVAEGVGVVNEGVAGAEVLFERVGDSIREGRIKVDAAGVEQVDVIAVGGLEDRQTRSLGEIDVVDAGHGADDLGDVAPADELGSLAEERELAAINAAGGKDAGGVHGDVADVVDEADEVGVAVQDELVAIHDVVAGDAAVDGDVVADRDRGVGHDVRAGVGGKFDAADGGAVADRDVDAFDIGAVAGIDGAVEDAAFHDEAAAVEDDILIERAAGDGDGVLGASEPLGGFGDRAERVEAVLEVRAVFQDRAGGGSGVFAVHVDIGLDAGGEDQAVLDLDDAVLVFLFAVDDEVAREAGDAGDGVNDHMRSAFETVHVDGDRGAGEIEGTGGDHGVGGDIDVGSGQAAEGDFSALGDVDVLEVLDNAEIVARLDVEDGVRDIRLGTVDVRLGNACAGHGHGCAGHGDVGHGDVGDVRAGLEREGSSAVFVGDLFARQLHGGDGGAAVDGDVVAVEVERISEVAAADDDRSVPFIGILRGRFERGVGVVVEEHFLPVNDGAADRVGVRAVDVHIVGLIEDVDALQLAAAEGISELALAGEVVVADDRDVAQVFISVNLAGGVDHQVRAAFVAGHVDHDLGQGLPVVQDIVAGVADSGRGVLEGVEVQACRRINDDGVPFA